MGVLGGVGGDQRSHILSLFCQCIDSDDSDSDVRDSGDSDSDDIDRDDSDDSDDSVSSKKIHRISISPN